jgi:hypothetical protein
MRSLEIVPAFVVPSRLPRPLAMPHAVVVRGVAIHAAVLLAAAMAAPALTHAAPTGNPAYTDPAQTDADFPFQGEYAGAVKTPDGEILVGVQVVALGDGMFDIVAYPGGLPGAGWQPPKKVHGKGTRSGEGAAAVVKIEADDGEGNKRQAEIKDGTLTVAEPDGAAVKLAKVSRTSPTLGQKPPAGAVVLFDGAGAATADVSKWTGGKVSPDGLLMEGVTTKDSFGDAIWHIEFRLPYQPKDRGQGRGNSGAYLQGAYEVQMLDSFGLEGKNNECGGIYSVAAPSVNMCLPPLAWQTYDITVTSPRFDGEKPVQNARMTVRHNGVLIHDDVEVPKMTPGGTPGAGKGSGPLHLQNHGNPVRYRNVWVLPKS